MHSQNPAHDPKGLIRESYRIDGITPGECRTIFLDWALSVPLAADTSSLIETLLDQYAETQLDHPMTQVLQDGLNAKPKSGRRGGRAARLSN